VAIGKPYVAGAMACEKVLLEKDGVSSAIRIVDTYTIPHDVPDGVKAAVRTTIFILLKSIEPLEGELSVALNTPNGERKEGPQKWPVSFSETIKGANILINLDINSRHIGWTWIDVIWNQEVITRIPIQLVRGDPPNKLENS
jgi:hypothetical protein